MQWWVFSSIFYMKDKKNSEVLGLRMGQNGQMEQSISIGLVQPRKVVHLKRWTDFLKLFRLVRTDPFSFWPKFAKILIEWIAPVTWKIWAASNLSQQHPTCRNRVAKCTQHVVPSNVAIYVALKCCDRLAGVLEVRNEVNINCFKQLLKTS